MSGTEGLFENLPEQREVQREEAGAGAPRLREACREQLELRVVDLESLLEAEHPARAVWSFVEGLDLTELLMSIKAREGRPGQAPPDPKIMLTLWLYATVAGVGSARTLARLCEEHVAFRWICGGVSMNYHTLAEFRVDHVKFLDRQLAQGVAALAAEGLVTLERLAQDGVRVRAAAGAASFRRRARLEELLAAAEARVAALKKEVESDPAASDRRVRSARERAARERLERTAAALERMQKLEAERKRREKTNKEQTKKQKEPRASTTDADARVMKMADAGFRPAYNAQIASDPASQVIVAVDIDTTGSDRGLMAPMLKQIEETYEQAPKEYLVDGGFAKNEDIETAFAAGIAVFAPPVVNKHGTDPLAPRPDDGPGMLAYRQRMASDQGKTMYRLRCEAECIHAQLRNRGLQRFLLRGRQKVRAVLLWFALAHNLLRAIALRRAATQAAAAS
jgi:transposase